MLTPKKKKKNSPKVFFFNSNFLQLIKRSVPKRFGNTNIYIYIFTKTINNIIILNDWYRKIILVLCICHIGIYNDFWLVYG